MNRAPFYSLLLATALAAPAFATPPQVSRGMPGMRFALPIPRVQGAAINPAKRSGGASAKNRRPVLPTGYTIIDDPEAGTASGQGTITVAVNASSVSTGYYLDGSNDAHGYVRSADGSFTNFDADGPTSQTQADWMNNKGAVVGFYIDPNTGIQEGFFRTPNGKITTFDGGPGGSSTGTIVNSVNDSNEAAGNYNDASNNNHGFFRLKDGTITQFDAPGATGTDAFDINDSGTIAGPYWDSGIVYHGYLRTAGGGFTQFDVAGAGTGSGQGTVPIGINRKGWVTGYIVDANYVLHGFVRDASGNVQTFDAPDAGTGTWPIELNAHGTIAGYYFDSSNGVHGFVRTKNGAITEFDAPGSVSSSGFGTYAFDINKYNIISGWFPDSNGVFHGYLRTP